MIGLSGEHEALRDAVRGWTGRHAGRDVVRQAAEVGSEALPPFWEKLAGQGFLAPHVPVEHGGGGYGLEELAVVLEELGRALVPGPVLPTVLTSAVLSRAGADGPLRTLADGTATAAVGLEPGLVASDADGGFLVAGTTSPVPGAAVADVLVLCARRPEGDVWFLARAGDVTTAPLPSLDLTRRSASVTVDRFVPASDVLTGVDVRGLAAVLAAAEACGVAAWCLATASEYAKVRVQFGRPIGAFQAVKHRCAEMLLALEEARAATWDAAREPTPLATAVAAVLAPDAAVRCAKDCVQILGGTGFTWEHDAHLYLRRALTLRALAGRADDWARQAATLAGTRRDVTLDLPAEAERYRPAARQAAAELAAATRHAAASPTADRAAAQDQRRAMADGGWIVPHLPAPWGRDAGPLEQLVIQQEFAAAGVSVPDLVIGAWVVPTLVGHGTDAQRERFLPPTLRGELTWCQLFSEPGAGSDLAALTTRAERVDGGWRLTGQKIWTSVAQHADWGICLARTDPDVPKHKGITYFLVDMRTPGIDVRPLRELTGRAMFNEVFLDGVLVPDDCVVGAPGDGWRLARTTLANERVALSSGWAMGAGITQLAPLVAAAKAADRPGAGARAAGPGAGAGAAADPADSAAAGAGADPVFGRLVCAEQAFVLLGLRATLRRLSGLEPGPTSSARKLLGIRHAQAVAEYGWSLLGADGAVVAGDTALWPGLMLGTRAMSIAGGTTEVQLNILAERILGLPRDP